MNECHDDGNREEGSQVGWKLGLELGVAVDTDDGTAVDGEKDIDG